MTEAEWLACDNLADMLYDGCATIYPDRISDRVLRLFAAACARRVWIYLVSEHSRAAVELSEYAADHMLPAEDLAIAWHKADAAVYEELNELPDSDPRIWAAYAAAYGSNPQLSISGVLKAVFDSKFYDEWKKEIITLLHECIGNPFRPCGFQPNWRTPIVLGIAEMAYLERDLPTGHLDNARLAVLSDALEEAGCDDAELLSHLRSPGPHVRGCWALDLILGKQ